MIEPRKVSEFEKLARQHFQKVDQTTNGQHPVTVTECTNELQRLNLASKPAPSKRDVANGFSPGFSPLFSAQKRLVSNSQNNRLNGLIKMNPPSPTETQPQNPLPENLPIDNTNGFSPKPNLNPLFAAQKQLSLKRYSNSNQAEETLLQTSQNGTTFTTPAPEAVSTPTPAKANPLFAKQRQLSIKKQNSTTPAPVPTDQCDEKVSHSPKLANGSRLDKYKNDIHTTAPYNCYQLKEKMSLICKPKNVRVDARLISKAPSFLGARMKISSNIYSKKSKHVPHMSLIWVKLQNTYGDKVFKFDTLSPDARVAAGLDTKPVGYQPLQQQQQTPKSSKQIT